MNPLLFTITFLTLMGILTSSEIAKYSADTHSHYLYLEHQNTSRAKELIVQTSYFTEYKQTQSDTPKKQESKPEQSTPTERIRYSKSLNYNKNRPPNNSRLNFYFLFHPKTEDPFHYETAAKLLQNLYGNQEFFSKIPNAAHTLLDALIAHKEETKDFIYPDELATIDLGNANLQRLFVKMLKGAEGYPSLLNFITFDKPGNSSNKQKVNFMFVSSELMHAIAPTIAPKLIALQKQHWEQIEFQEKHRDDLELWKNRTTLKTELAIEFDEIVRSGDCNVETIKNRFDFALSDPGNILFIEDKASGLCLREKYIKKLKRAR